MGGLSVIDRFLDVFTRYIDSGFGLLRPEVAYLSATLIVIDLTLAALFWAWGNEDVLQRLVRKTLYVGFFAFLITQWTTLTRVVFESFAGLGLKGAGAGLSQAEFLQPGRLARVGAEAGQPILRAIGDMMGFVSFFDNFLQIVILLFAWLIVITAFFVLAVQLFVSLVEFKLVTLAGFVLVPFGLFGKTAFLAEKVLGNVVASGVKVLVLAVIVGIGSTLFSEFTAAMPAGSAPTVNDALAVVLGSVALLGLGIYGPSIATGLVSGAPQLGAGAAAGSALTAAGVGTAAIVIPAAAGGAALGGVRAAASLAGGGTRLIGSTATGAGTGSAGPTGAAGAVGLAGSPGAAGAAAPAASVVRPSPASSIAGAPTRSAPPDSGPGWAERLRSRAARAPERAAHALRQGDGGGAGPSPTLDPDGRA